MIYFLFFASLAGILLLNYWQRLIEYFPQSKVAVYKPSASFIRKTVIQNFFRPEKNTATERSSKNKIALLKGLRNFLITFASVGLFFSILQFWLEFTAYSQLAKKTVFQIESALHLIKEKTKFIEKFQFASEMVIIFLLITLATVWPLVEKLKLKEHFKSLMKFVGIVLGILSIAISLTFFGNEINEEKNAIESNLQVHKLQILNNNRLLVKNIQETVEKKVIEELLNDPLINEILETHELVQNSIDSFTTSPDFEFFKNFDPNVHQLTELINLKSGDDPFSGASQAELKFAEDYKILKSKYAAAKEEPLAANTEMVKDNYYEDLRAAQYEELVQTKVVNEHILSTENLEHATQTFIKAQQEIPKINCKWYQKYSELLDKSIKKSYSATCKGWINHVISLVADIPLLGEILEPFHDIIKDMVVEKTKKILKLTESGNNASIMSELESVSAEMKVKIAEKKVSGGMWMRMREKVKSRLNDLHNGITAIRTRNISTERTIDEFIIDIKQKSRWQSIREEFHELSKVNELSGTPLQPFTADQWKFIDEAYNEWNIFIELNKAAWWKTGNNDLEKQFFNYIKSNPKAAGVWGFTIQQSDWSGAAYYFNYISPDPNAMGKPYFMLKYYCGTTGYGNINDVYNENVEEAGVDPLCH